MELNNGNGGKIFVTRMPMNRRKDTDKIFLKGKDWHPEAEQKS